MTLEAAWKGLSNLMMRARTAPIKAISDLATLSTSGMATYCEP